MLPTARVPMAVSTEDCLAWSDDGELAVAAGEEIYLLLPRREHGEPWTNIHFRVNEFTYDEWPRQRQRPFAEMSIGEEQARVTIVSLAWSPPGLAKHRRCALAILTSNLVLSLWAPGGQPTDPNGWQRVLILKETRVRTATWLPVQSVHAETTSPPMTKGVDGLWHPIRHLHGEPRWPGPPRKWGLPLMAVADDNHGISFLNVLNPFNSASKSWDYQQIGYEAITWVPKVNARPSILRKELDARKFINFIAFGEWKAASDLTMIYRSRDVFYQSMLTVSTDPLQIRLSDAYDQQQVPQDHHGRSPEAPSFMESSMQKQKQIYGTSHHLNEDEVVLKTWGVASSGDLFAVCVSAHPKSRVEYYAIVHSYATIVFGFRHNSNDTPANFPWQKVEAVDHEKAHCHIISSIFDPRELAFLTWTNHDFKILYAAICAVIFCELSDSGREICLSSTKYMLGMLEQRSGVDLSAERELRAAMAEGREAYSEAVDHLVEISNAANTELLSVCPICGDNHVGLSGAHLNFWKTPCLKGHPFSRCALTFLPILEPGCSKRCTICRREFLNEEKLDPNILKPPIGSDSNDQVTVNSLAAVLFDKFDVCPYCGGKYYN